ncbi:Multiple myeloma tumor-associated protein 2 [Thelohanellus kitauei]|uniref:Multiple myeloma tumor-associated protein 2 n=1 Tax=Thelohanellus kitauei TaxID=669202 RepID=A0A0C2JVE1_THEKT|nr:Multiple myeloma tumor-associated protein 2 [Thelohanellus kitauei]
MFKTFSDIDDPIRGGVRGGQDLFSWEQVKLDSDRESYLGHSVKAPVGRSQGGPDFLWYEKASKRDPKKIILGEKERIIQMESEAMIRILDQSYGISLKPILTLSHPLIVTPAATSASGSLKTKSSSRSKVKKAKSKKHSKQRKSSPKKSSHSHNQKKDRKRN